MENNAVGQPCNPAVIFQKKKETIFTKGFLFLKPGAIVDLETHGKMGHTKWQNSKTSPLSFILFPFTFRTTDEQQFGFA